MFLHMLNAEQRELFVHTAIELMSVDGAQSPHEVALLLHIERETGVQVDPVPADWQAIQQRIGAAFAGHAPAARAFMMDLAGVVVVDGVDDPREHELLTEVAASLGVPASDVTQFVRYATRLQDVLVEGRALLTSSSLRS